MHDKINTRVSHTRRDFLKSAAIAGGGAIAGQLSLARSAHAAGSDVFKIALVGCGGRGAGAAVNAIQNAAGANVKLVAMADAFTDRLESSLRNIEKKCPGKVDVPAERRFAGLDAYQKALAADIDMVLFCSPPGFRPLEFEAAVAAGKHIFMEKPVCVDAPGYRRVVAANQQAKEKGLMVAVGLNGRHSEANREAARMIHDGAIGQIEFLRAYYNASGIWNRPRVEGETEMQYQVKNWYFFTWLSGDQIVEQHVHGLDAVNWMMDDAHPTEANGMGGRQVRIGKEFGEIYDHFTVEYAYGEGPKFFSQSRHMANCWNTVARYAHGTRGTASFDRNGTIVRVKGKAPIEIAADKIDSHQTEHDHLFAALLAGKTYNEADYGAAASMTAVLGRMACYSGQVVTWDEAVKSDIDLAPPAYTWDTPPQPKPGADGLYPCALPGITKAV